MRSVKRDYENHSYRKGEIFGRLQLTGKSFLKEMYGQRRRMVEADCKCGVKRWYVFHLLVRGDTKSCGCYRRDLMREVMTTHGLTQHPLYDVYKSILSRCYNENDKAFKNYGARGISVCDDWQEDFMNFYNWAISNGWEPGKSIDRENNDGNYYAGNCRFTTRNVQSRNNRRNKMITAFGETKCLFDWGKDSRCVVSVWALRSRLDRGKWDNMEQMITTPQTERKQVSRSMKSNTMITAFGETKCMSAWLDDPRCVIGKDGIMDRIKRGWTDGDLIITTPSPNNKKRLPVI